MLNFNKKGKYKQNHVELKDIQNNKNAINGLTSTLDKANKKEP